MKASLVAIAELHSAGKVGRGACRRGVAAVMAMVVLLAISAMIALQLERVRRHWDQDRVLQMRGQLEVLLDAALQDGIQRVRKDSSWTGGRWVLSAGVLQRCDTVSVEISVSGADVVVQVRSPAELSAAAICRLTGKRSVKNEN